MSDLKHAHRIYCNVHVLLGKGLFPGEGAEALQEAQKFIYELVQKFEKDIASETKPAEDGNSDRDETSSGGMAGGRIPAEGRKGRRRKGDGA